MKLFKANTKVVHNKTFNKDFEEFDEAYIINKETFCSMEQYMVNYLINHYEIPQEHIQPIVTKLVEYNVDNIIHNEEEGLKWFEAKVKFISEKPHSEKYLVNEKLIDNVKDVILKQIPKNIFDEIIVSKIIETDIKKVLI